MKIQSTMFFGIFLLVYIAANYYVGFRFWQCFSLFKNQISIKYYWLTVIIFAISYFTSRITESVLLATLGGYWLGFLYYAVLFWLCIDIIIVIVYFVKRQKKLDIYNHKTGLLLLTLIFSLLAFGTINAQHPVIKNYEISIDKKVPVKYQSLKIVVVSDIHLGKIIGSKQLSFLVANINSLEPDLVFLPGDIIDEDLEPFINDNMDEELKKIKAPLGVFACFGNHEYLAGRTEEFENLLTKVNIQVLRDNYVKIDDAFYIIGRDDKSKQRIAGQSRLSVSELIADIDKRLPLIMLDHQPVDVDENASAGIDLQLSGHTHLGQIFPNNFITHNIFKIDWGHYVSGGYNIIVSCGFGTWGPPIRIGNRPEIVNVHVFFNHSN